jgi:DNA transformation protein
MEKLSNIVNIGKELERQLYEVGIYSIEELKKIGSKEAWLKIKKMDPSACINRLYALEGAILGIRWHDLDESIKKELKEFYEENK